MTIGVISVSSRANAASRQVAGHLAGRLESRDIDVELVDLYQLGLPLFGQELSDQQKANLDSTRQQLQQVAGVVVVIPEWNGAAAPGWSNLMLYIGDDLAHKPAMLVGVSAGRGGAYPLLGVRSAGYKNSRYVVIPESLIVSYCGEVFGSDGSLTAHPAAEILGARADYALGVLLAYARSLEAVRQGTAIDHDKYPSGV